MTQQELVIKYCEEFGAITPAKLVTRAYRNGWFDSELPRVCRRLRAKGLLRSEDDGRFEKFYLNTPPLNLSEQEKKNKVDTWLSQWKPQTKQPQLF